MTIPPKRDAHSVRSAWSMAQHALLAAALFSANTAEAWTLHALLQLPLERLMQLRVTDQRDAYNAKAGGAHGVAAAVAVAAAAAAAAAVESADRAA